MKESQQDTFLKRLQKMPTEIRVMIEKRLELFLLDLSEALSSWLAKTIHQIIGVLVLYIGIIYASAAAGLWLGDMLGNQALGFFIMSSPFLLIGIVLLVIKPRFIMQITEEKIQQQFLNFIDKSTQANQTEEEPKQLPPNE